MVTKDIVCITLIYIAILHSDIMCTHACFDYYMLKLASPQVKILSIKSHDCSSSFSSLGRLISSMALCEHLLHT